MERTNAVELPPPVLDADTSVLGVMADRRSRRSLAGESLSLDDLGVLCWAAQGVSDEAEGFRTAPSAGATYPLSLVVVVGEDAVSRVDAGVYRYDPAEHGLRQTRAGDLQADLQEACLDQSWVGDAPVDLVLTARPERTARQYGDRGRERYVPIEVGHAGQNVYLAAEALGYGTVNVGAFDDEAVGDIAGVADDEYPMAVYPVGVPR
ncbi:Nitroreductase [Halanaeroarchaeum sp. HSR-CO]|uniref:SagB/ThcOx family dehydrogenase n=1 Tax=Halanaeroarchaeum sp. HSR-CO TaxID=2866382 RepID=UPI00217DE30B|nr:SagB/ThcOx family dehydrogenase [Halanaeroarchaeum sp. HSR-CO]UWG48568.1 Nitroreductase [Halanaeroarchaeum sp. HSR-CO]